jgi:hypothetical protein
VKIQATELDGDSVLLLLEEHIQEKQIGAPSYHQTRMYLLSLLREKLHRFEAADILDAVENKLNLKKKV